MADNGSGVFSRLYAWATDRLNNVPITDTRFDDELDGIATAITNRICKDGQSTTSARIPFAAGVGLSDGTAAAPALNFTADPDTGIYRIGANNIGVSLGGTKVLDIASTGLTITGTLTASGTINYADNDFTLQDSDDATKQAQFQLSGLTTATMRTYTLPDADTTIVGTDTTQTLTNKTFDNTTALTIKDASFTLQDNSDTTKQLNFELSGITTGTTRTLTAPDADTTLVGHDTTQTLTNKTLTSPTINTPTVAGGTATGLTGLAIRSSGTGAFDVTFANTENLAAGRTLTFTLNDADRTVSLGGNVTTAAAFTTSGAYSVTLTATDVTSLTLPPTGTLATLSGSEALSNKTVSSSTLDNTNSLTIADNLLTLQDGVDATKQAVVQLSGITTGTTRTITAPDADITLLGEANTATVSSKSLDNTNDITVTDANLVIQDNSDTTKQLQFQLSGITTGTTRTITVPDADFTLPVYEVGDWTPTASFATAGTSSWAYTTQTGRYFRLGSQVTVIFKLTATPTVGTGSGTFRIGGLPFTINNTVIAGGNVTSINSNFSWSAKTMVSLQASTTTTIQIDALQDSSGDSAIAAAVMTTGASHTIQGVFTFEKV